MIQGDLAPRWQQEALGWSPCGGGTAGQGHKLSSVRVSLGPEPHMCGVSGAWPGGPGCAGITGGGRKGCTCAHTCASVCAHMCVCKCVHACACAAAETPHAGTGTPLLGETLLGRALPGTLQETGGVTPGWEHAPCHGTQPRQPWHQPPVGLWSPTTTHPANSGQFQAAPKPVPAPRWLTAPQGDSLVRQGQSSPQQRAGDHLGAEPTWGSPAWHPLAFTRQHPLETVSLPFFRPPFEFLIGDCGG